MASLGIGIVGGGYMGKAHSAAFAAAGTLFETDLKPRLVSIAASSAQSSADYARRYGFARGAADWSELVADPEVDAVVIASPQSTHLAIAEAALARGKHVLCEKPMGLDVAEARRMVELAEAAGVVNMVAFNYSRTPATQYARKLIAEGALGRITGFRCEHNEDFHNAMDLPGWRLKGAANGCLGDLAPHPINCALALMGPIAELNAVIDTVHAGRAGQTKDNDDQVQMMVRFESGVTGHISASRIATGRKMGYAYEVFGTEGAIRFDQEDQNALWVFEEGRAPAEQGYRKILTGPAHPDYRAFCLGPGHGTGYQDQIVIEAKDFIKAIESGTQRWPTFRDGLAAHQVVAAARASHETRSWARPADY